MLIIDEKNNFFLLYLLYNNGITYHLYINNIENSNRFSVGCSPLWADGKQTDKR